MYAIQEVDDKYVKGIKLAKKFLESKPFNVLKVTIYSRHAKLFILIEYDLYSKYLTDDETEYIATYGLFRKPLVREFEFKQKKMALEISPAFIKTRYGHKAFLPSQREEIVEAVLRKFVLDPNKCKLIDGTVSIRFTLYELWQELKRVKHTYGYNEIKESLDILARTSIVILENEKLIFSSTMFEAVGVVNDNKNPSEDYKHISNEERTKKITYYVKFNSLVSDSIKNGFWRAINYDQYMKYKKVLSRYLYKRMSYLPLLAEAGTPYNIMQSSIIRDSGMKEYAKMGDRIRQVKSSLQEMKLNGSIEDFKIENRYSEKRKNKIEDAKILIYPSKSFNDNVKFGRYIKRASDKNKPTTTEVTTDPVLDTSDNVYKPKDQQHDNKSVNATTTNKVTVNLLIDTLTKTVSDVFNEQNTSIDDSKIKLLLSKLKSGLLVESTLKNNSKACLQYIKKQQNAGKKCNIMSILTKAIKENWEPNSETPHNSSDNKTSTLSQDEIREQAIERIRAEVESKPVEFRGLFIRFAKYFGISDYFMWLCRLEPIETEGKDDNMKRITFSVETSFIKEYITRDFLNGVRKRDSEGNRVWFRKGIAQLCQEFYPNLEGVDIIVKPKKPQRLDFNVCTNNIAY
jgi:hypothetical protein